MFVPTTGFLGRPNLEQLLQDLPHDDDFDFGTYTATDSEQASHYYIFRWLFAETWRDLDPSCAGLCWRIEYLLQHDAVPPVTSFLWDADPDAGYRAEPQVADLGTFTWPVDVPFWAQIFRAVFG